MENNSNKKSSKWIIYLIPLYIIIAIPLIKWTLKLYSPDLNLPEDKLKAFNAQMDIKKENEDFKYYEPNLEDISYAVGYKNVIGVKEGKEYSTNTEKEDEEKRETSNNKKDSKKASDEPKASIEKKLPSVNEMKQKEMTSIGYKKGFLTQAAEKLLNNPKALKALFDNEFVVKGFLARETVKRNLSDPKALETYLSNSQAIANFLNNETVKKIFNNPQLLNTLAQSKMVSEIMTSPAVSALLSNQQKMNELLQKNPQLNEVLANPNVLSALSQNPQSAKILSNIK